ncbi:hypothetical protein B7R21_14680 [Subtercola boreus]|uniref:AB hydrolase-1 domain-containing protein n=1 Tax=Subtercola boreus TaxID=120213 RepID=A0A3E0VCQ8_9MICO|nr:alpha/beta hydrolase [Subtercola boreus]RFA07439.1 hypothetical protein B7R21_14680 [Subtercola boreus]
MMRRGYVDTSAGQVHVRTAGTGEEVVLLLHQTAASSAMFESFVEALGGSPLATYRFVALDTPGFGSSYTPAAPYSFGEWADVVLDVASAVDAREFHLLGHHTGAAIAIAVAAADPGRVLSLGMIGGLVLSQDEAARWHASVHGMTVDDEGSHLGIAWQQVAAIDGDPDAYPPGLALRQREVVDKLGAGERWHEAYLAVFGADLGSQLAATGCPAVLFSGTADVLHPYAGATLAARPGIRYHELAAGAYVLDQQPQLVAGTYLDFLKQVPR